MKTINVLENIKFLLDSGLSIVSSIDVLIKRGHDLGNLRKNIIEGKSFNDSLEKAPHLIRMFIQIGESCGNLAPMIGKAIETDKQIKKINQSFIGAISYPLFISFIAIVMMLITMVCIMPKLLPMFRDLKVELPAYTNLLICISNFLVQYGIYMVVLIASMVAIFILAFRKFADFRIKIEKVVLKTYLIRTLYVRYQTSIIALCVSEYLKAGHPLHDSLRFISDSVNSYAYSEALKNTSSDIQSGKGLILPENLMPNWTDMLELAIQTGRLSVQFERFYAENMGYLENVNTLIKRWSEPALMLFIGGMVALFAISIISPIYKVVQHVGV